MLLPLNSDGRHRRCYIATPLVSSSCHGSPMQQLHGSIDGARRCSIAAPAKLQHHRDASLKLRHASLQLRRCFNATPAALRCSSGGDSLHQALRCNSDGPADASSELHRAPSASSAAAARRSAFSTASLRHQRSADVSMRHRWSSGGPMQHRQSSTAPTPMLRQVVSCRLTTSLGRKKLRCSTVDDPREAPLQPRQSSNDSGGAPLKPRACSNAVAVELQRPRQRSIAAPGALHCSRDGAPTTPRQRSIAAPATQRAATSKKRRRCKAGGELRDANSSTATAARD